MSCHKMCQRQTTKIAKQELNECVIGIFRYFYMLGALVSFLWIQFVFRKVTNQIDFLIYIENDGKGCLVKR